MESTSKSQNTQTTKSAELKGKRLGRGAVESGLTHECGVFGVVGTGDWPTNVSRTHISCISNSSFFYNFLFYQLSLMSHKFAVWGSLLCSIAVKVRKIN